MMPVSQRALSVALILTLFGLAVGCGGAKPDVEDLRQMGLHGDKDRAVALLEAKKKDDPQDPLVRDALIDVYALSQDYDNALREATEMIDLFGGSVTRVKRAWVHYVAALALDDSHHMVSARSDVDEAIAAQPGWLEPYMFRALLDYESGDVASAREFLSRAEGLVSAQEKADDGKPRAVFAGYQSPAILSYMLGSVECALGNYESGIATFELAKERRGAEYIHGNRNWEIAAAEAARGEYKRSATAMTTSSSHTTQTAKSPPPSMSDCAWPC